jgi:hypothetical protein
MPTTIKGPLVGPQEIFSQSSTQKTDLGMYVETGDGRGFRYCLAGGTALVAGTLQQAAAEDTTNMQALTITNAAIGATSITTTDTTTLTVNQLAGGLLSIATGTLGVGFTYRIKGNTAATAAVATFYLEDPVIVATTGTAKIDVKPNAYAGVIINPKTASSGPVGAAVYNVTAAYYGWLQTHGPATILNDGGSTVGTNVSASNATAGAVEAAVTAQAAVGYALTGIATTEYGLIFLTLD